VFKESGHAEQSRDREILHKTGQHRNGPFGDVESHGMKPYFFRASNPLDALRNAGFKFEAKGRREIGVKDSA